MKELYYEIKEKSISTDHHIKRYLKFIADCRTHNEDYKGYLEKHHILPKAKELYPNYKNFSSNRWNMIKLTGRQHLIAHWMLAKIFGDIMWDAVWQMSNKPRRDNEGKFKLSSRLYEEARKNFSERQSSRTSKLWEDESFREMMSEMKTSFWEDDEKRSLACENMKDSWTDSRRKEQGKRSLDRITRMNSDPDFVEKRNAASSKLMLERSNTLEWKEHMSKVSKELNKIRKTCIYCGTESNPGNHGRYHGEKCKKKAA